MKIKDKAREFLHGLKRLFRYRSSVTGRFVEQEFAEGNKDTTEKEEIK